MIPLHRNTLGGPGSLGTAGMPRATVNQTKAWSPKSLFAASEQGVWYDPSDLTTMFEDAAGTTAVHVPGNGSVDSPVGLLLDKRLGGVGSNGAARYNLLTYTEQFDNAIWIKTGLQAFGSGSSANAAVAPDGTTTADYIRESTANSTHSIDYHPITITSTSVNHTHTVYVQAGERSKFQLIAYYDSGTYPSFWTTANLSDGTYTTGSSGGGTLTSGSVTSIGSGWYRVSVTGYTSAASTSNHAIQLRILDDSGNASYTGTGTKGLYIWGAQIALATAPSTYQKITSDWYSTIPGNHAVQATTAARPTLSARVNLLTATETLSTQSVTTVAATYTLAFSGTGTITLSGTKTGTYSAGTNSLTGVIAGTLTLTVSGSVTTADLRVTNDGVGLPAYQRVVDANTYDSVGFPYYLLSDGVDDRLASSSIDFTTTDKMTATTGLRRLTETQNQPCIFELSSISDNNTGVFSFWGKSIYTSPQGALVFYSKGTAGPQGPFVPLSGYPPPLTNVATVSASISTPSMVLRVNGTQAATATGSQGTGNYGNFPLYMFRRGDSTQQANIRMYGLIIRGAASTAAQIANAEAWMNKKTKAY